MIEVTARATACVFMMDVWIHGRFLFFIAIVKRDAFALFVQLIALYKTSVLLLLLLSSSVLCRVQCPRLSGRQQVSGSTWFYFGN